VRCVTNRASPLIIIVVIIGHATGTGIVVVHVRDVVAAQAIRVTAAGVVFTTSHSGPFLSR
jgi:hypothetical protein